MMSNSHRLDGERYLALLQMNGETLARVAERDLETDIPSCPGWSMEELVWHTGGVLHFWGTLTREKLLDPEAVGTPERPARDELVEWYRGKLRDVHGALSAADPSTRVWTWSGENDVAWVRRRMAQETAVHAWDATAATNEPLAIDSDLALDGVSEFLEFFIPKASEIGDVTVHLHATDADGEWFIAVNDGQLAVRHEHAKGDVAVRGTASNLLLLLWGRLPEAEVEVHGDRAALFRFLEAADLD